MLTMHIAVIPRTDLCLDLRDVTKLSLFTQFVRTTMCAFLDGCSEIDLRIGVRKHLRCDIPAIHHDRGMLREALLQLHHLLPHGRILGHRGCGITDLLGTNPGGDIGAVQEDLLSAFLIIGDRDVDVAHRLRHARLIREGDGLIEAEQTDGTVHGTGIDVNIAEF